MMTLVTVDPGKHVAGIAMFVNGQLDACGLIGAEPPTSDAGFSRHPLLQNILTMKGAARNSMIDKMVVEIPRIYPQRRTPGDPNDLIAITLTAGAVPACFGHIEELQTVAPSDWKGQVKKEIMLQRIAQALEDHELEILTRAQVPKNLKHNVIDAIGIGLWSLRRINRKGNPKNGT